MLKRVPVCFRVTQSIFIWAIHFSPSFKSVYRIKQPRKEAKVVLQTLGVGFRVSQRRESDTRPVWGDNEETEAQPQSHMKGIFGGWVGLLFPRSPSTLRHTHTHTSFTFLHTCSSWLPPPPLSDSHKDKTSPWILWHRCCRVISVCFSCCLALFTAALSNCLSSFTLRSPVILTHTHSIFDLIRHLQVLFCLCITQNILLKLP